MHIEALESRIAPASFLTFTDVDGDIVTIRSSVGDLAAPGVATFAPRGAGEQLQTLTLTDPSFQNASITTSVVRADSGDGFVNIGRIDATGRDLGRVFVRGDLGVLDCGDAATGSAAIKLLHATSMGTFGTATGAPDLQSDILGALNALKVDTDIKDAAILVEGGADGTDGMIGSVKIGGSLIGGAAMNSGTILSSGEMGVVRINGDLIGGDGVNSGHIVTSAALASVTIGGSVFGGRINGGDTGPIRIRGDLVGGEQTGSGLIDISGTLASLTIGGSVLGGSGNGSGTIASHDNMGALRIGGDLVGASISGAESIFGSGFVLARRIASVTIGGSIISGIDLSTGVLVDNASIRAINDIGPIIVRGGLVGHSNPDGDSPVMISARGQEILAPGATSDVAIESITIGGSVEFARILAGYSSSLDAENGNASIGKVEVGGNWIASDLVAGVQDDDDALLDARFGDADDRLIPGFDADGIIAQIANVLINGSVIGTGAKGDHFGFVAERIGAFRAGGVAAPLTPGDDVIELSPATGDVTIREP